jgi:hypothetical protein
MTITPSYKDNYNGTDLIVPTPTTTWTSSNTAAATVSGGVVTGIARGSFTIAATSGSINATSGVITVQGCTSIGVSPSGTQNLSAGGSVDITATPICDPFIVASSEPVVWSSSNALVATVSGTGTGGHTGHVTAVAAGSATVKACATLAPLPPGGLCSPSVTISIPVGSPNIFCGEAACAPLGGALISHFTGPNCNGVESYYTLYNNNDGIRRSWNGAGLAGTALHSVTNKSWKQNDGGGDGTGCRVNAWPSGNTLPSFVTVYRAVCGEASCTALGGAYISHFTNSNCTGTESYYTPYLNSDGIRRSWDGGGIAGTVLRTVTNKSWKQSDGGGDGTGCRVNAWPAGNTLPGFVTIYR